MRLIQLLNSTNLIIRGFFDNFTLYYILLASRYTILRYTVFQKYTWQRTARFYCIWRPSKNLWFSFLFPNFAIIRENLTILPSSKVWKNDIYYGYSRVPNNRAANLIVFLKIFQPTRFFHLHKWKKFHLTCNFHLIKK